MERRGEVTEPVLSNPLSSDKWSWYVNTKCPSHFPDKWLNMETLFFHIWLRINPQYPTYHSIKQAAVAPVEWDCKIRNLLEIKMSMRWYKLEQPPKRYAAYIFLDHQIFFVVKYEIYFLSHLIIFLRRGATTTTSAGWPSRTPRLRMTGTGAASSSPTSGTARGGTAPWHRWVAGWHRARNEPSRSFRIKEKASIKANTKTSASQPLMTLIPVTVMTGILFSK